MSKEKKDIIKLLTDRNTILELRKKLNRYHKTIEKEDGNICKIRIKNGFKYVAEWDFIKN